MRAGTSSGEQTDRSPCGCDQPGCQAFVRTPTIPGEQTKRARWRRIFSYDPRPVGLLTGRARCLSDVAVVNSAILRPSWRSGIPARRTGVPEAPGFPVQQKRKYTVGFENSFAARGDTPPSRSRGFPNVYVDAHGQLPDGDAFLAS